MELLPHVGIIVGIGLVWYGRSHNSDLRIIGYIILAPSLFGLLKANVGVDLAGKIQGGAPASGEALPQYGTVSAQSTIKPSILTSVGRPPETSFVSFGVLPQGGKLVNPAYARPLTVRK